MRVARVAVVEALGFMAEGAEVSGEGVFAAAAWEDEASPAVAIASEALAEARIAEAASTAAHIAAAVMPAVAIAAHMAEAGIAAVTAMVDIGAITAMPVTATAIPAGTAVAADGAPLV
jgi:hypothetical protein